MGLLGRDLPGSAGASAGMSVFSQGGAGMNRWAHRPVAWPTERRETTHRARMFGPGNGGGKSEGADSGLGGLVGRGYGRRRTGGVALKKTDRGKVCIGEAGGGFFGTWDGSLLVEKEGRVREKGNLEWLVLHFWRQEAGGTIRLG